MKYLTTLLLSTLSLIASIDSCAQEVITIETPIYTVIYSEEYQQPLVVDYTVICTPGSKSYPRNVHNFTRVSGVNTSTGSDYDNNVWDKGHMAPASTFSCREDWLKETFTYVNCALQHENLNRGAWARLEAFERDLAGAYQDITVHIEIFFSDEWTDDETPARIPASFVKSLTWAESDGTRRTLSFDFPNEDTKGKSFWSFLIE